MASFIWEIVTLARFVERSRTNGGGVSFIWRMRESGEGCRIGLQGADRDLSGLASGNDRRGNCRPSLAARAMTLLAPIPAVQVLSAVAKVRCRNRAPWGSGWLISIREGQG
jgi:hypothetical protein